MIVFWLVCAVLILIALAFILPPLLRREEQSDGEENKEANVAVYRDQLRELKSDWESGIISPDQYQQDRDEIERRLLDDVSSVSRSAKKPAVTGSSRNLAYALGLALPAIAVISYLHFGNQNARDHFAAESAPPATASAPSANQSDTMTSEAIAANVQKLAKRLEAKPDDAEGWKMLARSYSEMQRYKDAADAYEQATKLVNNDAELWADYAFAVAMINGREMQGKPTELVNKALQIDPNNWKALLLAGNAAFSQKNYNQALQYWNKVMKVMPKDSSDLAQSLSEKMAEAKRLAGGDTTR